MWKMTIRRKYSWAVTGFHYIQHTVLSGQLYCHYESKHQFFISKNNFGPLHPRKHNITAHWNYAFLHWCISNFFYLHEFLSRFRYKKNGTFETLVPLKKEIAVLVHHAMISECTIFQEVTVSMKHKCPFHRVFHPKMCGIAAHSSKPRQKRKASEPKTLQI